MTERQYRQLLRNRRRAPAQPLFASAPARALLRSAAVSVRWRQRAHKALEAVLEPEWLELTQVEGYVRGALTLLVSERVAFERVRGCGARLERQLARRIPGFRRLRVLFGGRGEQEAG